jgi:ferritin-like metal-binding protein YciE
MAKVLPPSRSTAEHTRVDNASHILKRYYVVERTLLRTLGAWFVATSQWDLKRQLSAHLWQTTQHGDSLRTRVLEMRYPRRDVDRKYDADVLAFMGEIAKASDPQEFIAGVYGVVLPALVASYQAYLERTDTLDDAPTVYRLRHILLDQQTQIEQMNTLTARVLPQKRDSDYQWQNYLREWLDSIGGFDGLGETSERPDDHPCAGRPAYDVPHAVQRDARWRPALFHLPHENKYDKAGIAAWKRIEALDQRVAMQVWSAISHFNEIWAAEVPASVMWELDGETWAFYMDLSRWTWDETRHSTMGWRALESWGWDVPDLIPFAYGTYNALANVPPIQRLALLYFYEEGLLRAGTKQIEIKILESAQDDGSIQDMDYDWADEAMHVNFGYTWLKHLLGDDEAGRDELKRLTDEARDIMAKFVLAHKDDPAAQLAPYFERLYPVVAQMIRDIPDDDLNVKWAPVVADEGVLEEL